MREHDGRAGNYRARGSGKSFSPRPPPMTSPDGQKPLPVGGVHALCHGQRPSTVERVRVYDINESAESIIPTRDINVLRLPVASRDRYFAPSKQIIAIIRVVRKLLDIENFLDMVQFRRNAETAASHGLQSAVIKRDKM